MANIDSILSIAAPRSMDEALRNWPQRDGYTDSPADWRDEVFYFLLVDRFSNGKEAPSNLLSKDLSTTDGIAAIRTLRGSEWNWSKWCESGGQRYQGGTLKGVQSKLPYLKGLGVSTLWLSPVLRQRVEEDTYHGYGIQDFLEVDPRFGTRRDLVQLVEAAHRSRMKVILDIIFNHSGCNWLYDASAGDVFMPAYRANGSYAPIWPRSGMGGPITGGGAAAGTDDYVWPSELRGEERYTRAGRGDLGKGNLEDPNAEHKRTDFCVLRKFNLDSPALETLVLLYQYWIALTDADGFRIDTFKHVTFEQARNFCNALKEYAEVLGKEKFFLVAEVAGGNNCQSRYLSITGRNLDACLDIGEQREVLCNVAKGLEAPADFFAGFDYYDMGMGSHRNWGSQHLSISNDHDHVFGSKIRFAADAAGDHQATTAAALQFFAQGVPCLYYGTEQGLASGAEPEERKYLPWGGNDCLLREAMFGPEHPRAKGWAGTQGQLDAEIPGFGPHGTLGKHVFNPKHPLYVRIASLAAVRRDFKPLRRGRQYRRQTSFLSYPFGFYGGGELLGWARLYDDQEVLVVVNTHGRENRGARVVVDAKLSRSGMKVMCNTNASSTMCQVGSILPVMQCHGWNYVYVESVEPCEVLVLANESAVEAAGKKWR